MQLNRPRLECSYKLAAVSLSAPQVHCHSDSSMTGRPARTLQAGDRSCCLPHIKHIKSRRRQQSYLSVLSTLSCSIEQSCNPRIDFSSAAICRELCHAASCSRYDNRRLMMIRLSEHGEASNNLLHRVRRNGGQRVPVRQYVRDVVRTLSTHCVVRDPGRSST
jgi:hypothetical protein